MKFTFLKIFVNKFHAFYPKLMLWSNWSIRFFLMDFRRSKGIQHFLTNVNWEQKNVFQWRFVSIFLVKILTQFSPGDNGVNFKGGSESNIKSAWMLKEVAGLLVYSLIGSFSDSQRIIKYTFSAYYVKLATLYILGKSKVCAYFHN